MSISIEYEYIWYVCKKVTPKGLHVNLQYSTVLHMDMCHKLQYCYTLLNSKLYILVQACPAKESSFISIWPPFFQHQYDNRRLSRQNAGGACLYIPNNGHWATNFEVIPPPKNWLFRCQKKENSGGKPSVSALNFQARTAFFLTFFRNFVTPI